MNIKLEIFGGCIKDAVLSAIRYKDINADDIVDTTAIKILDEIKSVINNTEIEDDYEVVEQIVLIFEKYNIDAGMRHDCC